MLWTDEESKAGVGMTTSAIAVAQPSAKSEGSATSRQTEAKATPKTQGERIDSVTSNFDTNQDSILIIIFEFIQVARFQKFEFYNGTVQSDLSTRLSVIESQDSATIADGEPKRHLGELHDIFFPAKQ